MVRKAQHKPITQGIKKIYVSAKTPHGSFIITTKKKSSLEWYPLLKNPMKRPLTRAGKEPKATTTFYYADRCDYFCISCNGLFISIPEDDLEFVLRGMEIYLKNKQKRHDEEIKIIQARTTTKQKLADRAPQLYEKGFDVES